MLVLPDTPRVLAITGDETGSIMWRIWQPFAELRRRGVYAQSVHKDESDKFLTKIAAGYYDAVVTPRIAWPGGVGTPWQRAIRAAGLVWIYEIDDDVYSEAIVGRQYRIFEHERALGMDGLEVRRQERIAAINACDAITVSSRRLATVVSAYTTKPVFVVPNAIDARWFTSVIRSAKTVNDRLPELRGKLTIGWAGGTRDTTDMTIMAEAWRIIEKKYPHVDFVVQGHISERLVGLDRVHTLPWVPLPDYPRALVNIDIGCCSVAPTIFNSAKTPIKWFEFTLARAPCVVSHTLYGQVVTHNVDGYVARDLDDWVDGLSRMIEDPAYRRSIRQSARRTVMEHHSLENNWWRWPDAWTQAIQRVRTNSTDMSISPSPSLT